MSSVTGALAASSCWRPQPVPRSALAATPSRSRPAWPVRVGSSCPILTRVPVLGRGVGCVLTRRCLRLGLLEHFPIRTGTFVGLRPPLSPTRTHPRHPHQRLGVLHPNGDAHRV